MKGDNLFSFIGGALVGAAIAILFAPSAGDQTRKKIKDTFDKEFQHLKSKMKPENEDGNGDGDGK